MECLFCIDQWSHPSLSRGVLTGSPLTKHTSGSKLWFYICGINNKLNCGICKYIFSQFLICGMFIHLCIFYILLHFFQLIDAVFSLLIIFIDFYLQICSNYRHKNEDKVTITKNNEKINIIMQNILQARKKW